MLKRAATIHLYDPQTACLYLQDGQTVSVKSHPDEDVLELLVPLTEWARHLELIRPEDHIAVMG